MNTNAPILDFKKISQTIKTWYLDFNIPTANQNTVSEPFKKLQPHIQTDFYQTLLQNFIEFIQSDNMYILRTVPQTFNPKYPFFFLDCNENVKLPYLYNKAEHKYQPIIPFKITDKPENLYQFTFVSFSNRKSPIVINYKSPSVSYCIFKNNVNNWQWYLYPKLNLAVAISNFNNTSTLNKPYHIYPLNIHINKHTNLIIAPVQENIQTHYYPHIPKNVSSFLQNVQTINKLITQN